MRTITIHQNWQAKRLYGYTIHNPAYHALSAEFVSRYRYHSAESAQAAAERDVAALEAWEAAGKPSTLEADLAAYEARKAAKAGL